MIEEVVIAGAAALPGQRRPSPELTAHEVLAQAFHRTIASAGLRARDVDGLGVGSFGLRPDRAVDLAWQLGLSLRWAMDDVVGLNLVSHAARAIAAGDASTVVLLGGDCLLGDDFRDLAANLNRTTRDYLGALLMGPNALFALLTRAHMAAFGLDREAYGRVVVAQRAWAGLNPDALYRAPLDVPEYLVAPMVADPLCRLDCVPLVAGAEGVVLTRAPSRGGGDRPVMIRAIEAVFDHDQQEGDGLTTGLRDVAPRMWERSGVGLEDLDLVCVYDDYPVMVLVQLEDLGLIERGDATALLQGPVGARRPALNSSGGMLCAGQAGAGGTFHGLVECVRQLRGERGSGQISGARIALAASSSLAIYRYGACAAAAVLECASA